MEDLNEAESSRHCNESSRELFTEDCHRNAHFYEGGPGVVIDVLQIHPCQMCTSDHGKAVSSDLNLDFT